MSSVENKVISVLQTSLLVCLLVYCAWLSSQFIWHSLVPDSGEYVALSELGSATKKSASSRRTEVSNFHLFGEVGALIVKKPDEPKVAPKTRLKLILKGVFTAEQGGESGAIVEEIGKSADYYRLGDTLPGNAVLEEVYSDRVLLRRDGRLETLSFEEQQGRGNRIAESQPIENEHTENNSEINTPEQFIEEANRRLLDDPEGAIRSVGLAPARGGGYIYQGGNPMLSDLNLNKGDIIRSVNGYPLGEIKKDKSLMTSLYEEGSLEVEVVRDGASFYINYPLR